MVRATCSGMSNESTAARADDEVLTGAGWIIALATFFTLLFYIPLRLWLPVIPIHGLALFYGPMLASYLCRDNVVGKTAFGGLLAMLIVGIVQFVSKAEVLREVFLMSRDTDLGKALLIGVPLAAAIIWPTCLLGAIAGDFLARNRRERERTAAKSVE